MSSVQNTKIRMRKRVEIEKFNGVEQGWPDFFTHGPNWKTRIVLRAAKKLNKFLGSFFFIFRQNYVNLRCFPPNLWSTNEAAHLQVNTGGRKNSLEGRMRPAGLSLAMPAIYVCVWVSISSTFYVRILRTNVVFLVTFWLCQKIRTKNSYVKRWWNWKWVGVKTIMKMLFKIEIV